MEGGWLEALEMSVNPHVLSSTLDRNMGINRHDRSLYKAEFACHPRGENTTGFGASATKRPIRACHVTGSELQTGAVARQNDT